MKGLELIHKCTVFYYVYKIYAESKVARLVKLYKVIFIYESKLSTNSHKSFLPLAFA